MAKQDYLGKRWAAVAFGRGGFDIGVAIEQAMRIIAPPLDQSAECRELLKSEYMSIVIDSVNAYWSTLRNTKRSKMAARRFGNALRRVLHTWNAVKDDLHIPTMNVPNITEPIEEGIKRCDEAALAPAPRRALAQPEKLNVALLCVRLLQRYGGKVTVTRKGQLNQLVGVLLGNPGGDYTFVCRQALAQLGAK